MGQVGSTTGEFLNDGLKGSMENCSWHVELGHPHLQLLWRMSSQCDRPAGNSQPSDSIFLF